MAKVEVSFLNKDTNKWLSSSSAATFSTTQSWRTAFLNSPGSPGSNFSYTTPVLPAGNYQVYERATDQHGNATVTPPANVTVTIPPGNIAPVANIVTPVSCVNNNVCTFDARQSTDEHPATLTYAWSFGAGQGSGTGGTATKTYTTPGTYTVSVVATDEWGFVSAPASTTVTIATPPNNHAPVAVINPPSCSGLSCNFSAAGTADQDTGDAITYKWEYVLKGNSDWTTIPGSSAATTKAFSLAGTYTVRLTATDGWGAASTPVTRDVTVPPQ